MLKKFQCNLRDKSRNLLAVKNVYANNKMEADLKAKRGETRCYYVTTKELPEDAAMDGEGDELITYSVHGIPRQLKNDFMAIARKSNQMGRAVLLGLLRAYVENNKSILEK